jgi:Protein of unknown function (DUF2584)
MGMPCEVNSILKLKRNQGYPAQLLTHSAHQATKEGYRIIPIDVPIPLADENWMAYADVIVSKLTWHNNQTILEFTIDRIYKEPFIAKE